MFAAPGTLLLLVFEYLRPQEYFPVLRVVPLLHVSAALAALGLLLDLRLGLTRLRPAPHLWLVLLFFGWCLATLAVSAPDQLAPGALQLLVPLTTYLLVAHVLQSFRGLQLVCGVLLAIGLALAALGVEQGLAPYSCHRVAGDGGDVELISDGRPCQPEARRECEDEGAEPGADYLCERAGLLGTSSVGGRVRFRGTLQDPNELALAVAIVVPLAFAFLDRRRTRTRLLLVVSTLGLVGLCVLYTRSRGGQLVFVAVLATYFVQRFGGRAGVLASLALALPVMMLGGRGGDAASSTLERLECWWVGLHLSAASPVFGVGAGQFLEHHYHTAHNTFVLAAAELGLPGLLLLTGVLYLSVKIAVVALRSPLPPVVHAWAVALLASQIGMAVGIFFLSFAYKDLLWIQVGLTGLLHQAIQRHDPEFQVRYGLRDLGVVAAMDAGLLLALTAYTASRFGW